MAYLHGIATKMSSSVGQFTFKRMGGATIASEKVTNMTNRARRANRASARSGKSSAPIYFLPKSAGISPHWSVCHFNMGVV